MNHSTHYNLNLAEGTDLVNPLTIDVPNYQTIDSTMYANEQAGVGTATELKTGTIHAITRANQNRNVFKFTASSIFNSGDTFTVDGSTVTALYPDQSSLKDRCFIVGSDVLCLLSGSQLTLLTTYFPEANTVSFNDTNVRYTATNVQTAIENASTATGTSYDSSTSIKTKIDDNIVSVISLNEDNFYWTSSAITSGSFLSRASLSQIIGTRTYLCAMISDDYYGGVMSIGYSSNLDKFYVYGFEYDPSLQEIKPIHSSTKFKVKILVKG